MAADTTHELAGLPPGDYAIVEILGHRTLVGRTEEVERFGTKLLSVEPLFGDRLLPAVLVGGSAIYAFTPCTPDAALKSQPRRTYELPPSLRATLPPDALPAPTFAPSFLTPDEIEEDD